MAYPQSSYEQASSHARHAFPQNFQYGGSSGNQGGGYGVPSYTQQPRTTPAAITPPFFFQIIEMEENRLIQPRTHPYTGFWMPPRQIHGSRKKLGNTTAKFYYFNGHQTEGIDTLPQEAALFKTASMYHDHEWFWMVPYDATTSPVGNGRQDGLDPDTNEDEDEDAEAEIDWDEQPNLNTVDWTILYFLWHKADMASEATFTGNQLRLATQRPDQKWATELIPTGNQAPLKDRTTDIRFGGLLGDLAIILALLVLSVRPCDLDAVVKKVIRGVTGDGASAGWSKHGHSHLRIDRRGVIIKIWTYPPYSTPQTLMDLEAGKFGLIYR
ncbi:hypothetical protein EJ08DRAFT_701780 [Tothia fuscella]|uniref:Uncharacterized protein n=1 Tax=Tothia fuscella TaxID=1048955 RepID=A0A9P4NI65_9PEZI|nr:hypothetical protein EJ08DRAFT_701780 [Tothia fuscella]